jgi:hypothetical protein
MILAKCDKHSDRNAVITVYIKFLPQGTRSTPFGISSSNGRWLDFCEECQENLRSIVGNRDS